AVSPWFDTSAAMKKVEKGIWSFHSWRDFLWVGLGTSIFGCFDGRHGPAAGMIGFRQLATAVEQGVANASAVIFEQTCHTWKMVRQFHAAGHFGYAHRVFIAETIAPILMPRRD